MHIFDPCCYSSDLAGVNPANNDRMILYYRLMTKVDWFRRNTVFSWVGCHTLEREEDRGIAVRVCIE
jgi:hypothetical protein